MCDEVGEGKYDPTLHTIKLRIYPKSIPHQTQIFFEAINVNGPQKKIIEFNSELNKITKT